MLTAKTVNDSKGQIIVLPEEIRFEGSKVCIRKTGECVMLISAEKVWDTFLDGISGFTDDYFEAMESRNSDKA